MAARVLLHVGTMKSGTSYLQSLLWKNRDLLAERGLLLPGGRRRGAHFHAAAVVTGAEDVLARLGPRDRDAWERLLRQTAATDGDVVISNESFANADAAQADRALRRLEEVAGEVHVLLTARDLARQLPSAWQQAVKRGHPASLDEFWAAAAAEDSPTDPFRLRYDASTILERWSVGLPPSRVHLLVLPGPGSGAPRDWLWLETLRLLGIDPAGLDHEPERVNDSLGLVEVEVLRRVQASLPADRRDLDTFRWTRGFAQDVLTGAGPGERFAPTAAMQEWAAHRSREMVDRLRAAPWHVVGDLDDLLSPLAPPPGRHPGQEHGDEVAAVAVEALTRQLLLGMEQRDRMRALRAELRQLRDATGDDRPHDEPDDGPDEA